MTDTAGAVSAYADDAAYAAIARAVAALRDAGLDYWLTVDLPAGGSFQAWKPAGRHDWKLGAP